MSLHTALKIPSKQFWRPYSVEAALVRKLIPDIKRNLKMDNGLLLRASIKKHLMFFRGHALQREEAIATLLASYTPLDGVIYDVGANIGLYSLAFAANRQRRVLAFEPFDAALKYLKHNIRQNNLTNIEVHEIVLTDHKGTCRFTFDNVTTSTSHLSAEGEPGEELPCSDLDSYVKEHNLPFPHLIKMDVEGSDPQIIKGLSWLVEAARPLVYLEGPTYDASGEVVVIKFLKERGYRIFDIERQREFQADMREYAFIACP